jgi:mono/diheme cytochrome c family protein
MKRRNKILTAVSLLGLTAVFASCASQLYHPVSADASWASQKWEHTSVNDLARGRKYYVTHCSSCHQLHLPSEKDEKGWVESVKEMQEKARIPDSTANLIIRYLVTGSNKAVTDHPSPN